jgi:hypothetical protein
MCACVNLQRTSINAEIFEKNQNKVWEKKFGLFFSHQSGRECYLSNPLSESFSNVLSDTSNIRRKTAYPVPSKREGSSVLTGPYIHLTYTHQASRNEHVQPFAGVKGSSGDAKRRNPDYTPLRFGVLPGSIDDDAF